MKRQVKTRRLKSPDGTVNEAVYSTCEKYRYKLTRRWNARKPAMAFIMLNPSTATEMKNDPTIERCERRARSAKDCGGIIICNLFAYRATKPTDLKKQPDPVGAKNNQILKKLISDCAAGRVSLICGWGTHGAHQRRDREVYEMFAAQGIVPMALKWTKGGHPQHPLYISYKAVPVRGRLKPHGE